jgi:hypothetical protein
MRAGHSNATALLVPLLLLVAVPAGAQSRSGPIEGIRAPEVFVHIGRFRAGSDEGAIGNAPSYGATVTVPVSRRFAADLDYQTSNVTTTHNLPYDLFTYETRRRLVVPSLLYRFGRNLAYGFIGGGIGAEFIDDLYRHDYRPESWPPGTRPPPAGWPELPTGVLESYTSRTRRITSFRGGVVAFPTRRLGVRGDLYIAGWHLGARIGVGYRF